MNAYCRFIIYYTNHNPVSHSPKMSYFFFYLYDYFTKEWLEFVRLVVYSDESLYYSDIMTYMNGLQKGIVVLKLLKKDMMLLW